MSNLVTLSLALLLVISMSQTTYQPQGVQNTVQSTRVVDSCSVGYTWNNQICIPCQTLANGYCTCSTMYTCTTKVCLSGYILVRGACYAIPQGCTSYGPAPQFTTLLCFACSTGYTLIGSICVPNNNCATYNTQTAVCTSCAQGYYFNWDLQYTIASSSSYTPATYMLFFEPVCTACPISQCQVCSSGSTCNTCNPGYFWTPPTSLAAQTSGTGAGAGTCTGCMSQCNACTSSTTCTSCFSGYFLTTSSSSVVSCPSCSSNPQPTTGGTSPFGIANCATCNLPSSATVVTCLSCQSGFQLIGGACVACPSTCTNCSAANVCTGCIAGYILDTTANSCTQCPTGCQTSGCAFVTGSSGTVTCNACVDTYYRNPVSTGSTTYNCYLCTSSNNQWIRCGGPNDTPAYGTLQPTQCIAGYFLFAGTNNTNSCVIAVTSNTCAQISTNSGTTCALCLPNYQITGTSCYACPAACPNSCQYSTIGSTTQASCTSCTASGYFFTQATTTAFSTCTQCSTGCSGCTSASSTSCTGCVGGYYLNSGSCTQCAPSCSVCASATTCQTCQSGFFLSNGLCYGCQQGCATCTGNGQICTTCVNGYLLQNGGCVTLAQANCFASNETNGCDMCNYGYQLFFTDLGSTPERFCLQCISLYTTFVCRQNFPIPGTPAPYSAATTSVIALTNLNQGVVTAQLSTKPAYACLPGYYWTTQSCMPCQTVANGTCTCESINTCGTVTCNTGYLAVGNLCVTLPPGCTTYILNVTSTAYICTACTSDYTLVGNVCIVNGTQCSKVSTTSGICSACTTGYYFNWDYDYVTPSTLTTVANYYLYFPQMCIACTLNCVSCPSATTCNQCRTGYYWQQSTYVSASGSQGNQLGKCSPCSVGCSACTSSTMCTTCLTGYYQNTTAATSTTTASQTCSACPTFCAICQNSTTCQTCITGYSLSNNQCTQTICNSPCATCTTTNGCATCLPGYLLSNSNGQATCVACPIGCISCGFLEGTSTTTCTGGCYDLYYQSTSSSNQQVTCVLCSSVNPAWIRCSSMTQPTQCQNGYYLYQGMVNGTMTYTCVQQSSSPTCLTVGTNVNSNCLTCLPGYQQAGTSCINCQTSFANCTTCTVNSNATSLVCQGCVNGYYVGTNNVCVACSSGCITCSANGCSSCTTGNYLQSSVGASPSVCIGCPVGCGSCTTQWNCTTCLTGYYSNPVTRLYNGDSYLQIGCFACQQNCATCVAPGQLCTECNSGYVLQSGGCVTLAQANCYTAGTNGCSVCNYGFQLVDSKYCVQCIGSLSNYACNNNITPVNPVNPDGPVNPDTPVNPTPPTPTPTNTYGSNLIVSLILIFILMLV